VARIKQNQKRSS